MILPTTLVLASESLDANFLSSLRTARTSSNVTLPPTLPSNFSTRMVLPGSARYCFPPLRITAYILPPEASDKPQSYRIQATSVNEVSLVEQQYFMQIGGELAPQSAIWARPNGAALFGRPHHRVAGLAVKSIVKLRQVAQRPDDPVFADWVRIGQHELALRIGANFVAARLSPGDEKLLLRRESILIRRPRLALHLLFKREIRQLHSTKIADTLAQDQFAVDVHSAFHGVLRKLIDHTFSAALKFFVVRGRPPLFQFAGAIVLGALVVEAVRDLVPNHRADAAVIHRVGRVHIEHRRQQDARREHDLVQQRIVVRVRGWRGHAPAAAIDWLADETGIIAHRKTARRHHVVPEEIARNVDAAVILPAIRIADLWVEGRKLEQRFLFGLVAHPGEGQNIVVQRRENVVHHFLHPRFRFRGKCLFHVLLAQRLAQVRVGRFHATLPARLHLGRALQVFLIECEIFLDEGRGKAGRSGTQQVPGQIRLPVFQRSLLKLPLDFLQELGLIDVYLRSGIEPLGLKINGPVEIWR